MSLLNIYLENKNIKLNSVNSIKAFKKSILTSEISSIKKRKLQELFTELEKNASLLTNYNNNIIKLNNKQSELLKQINNLKNLQDSRLINKESKYSLIEEYLFDLFNKSELTKNLLKQIIPKEVLNYAFDKDYINEIVSNALTYSFSNSEWEKFNYKEKLEIQREMLKAAKTFDFDYNFNEDILDRIIKKIKSKEIYINFIYDKMINLKLIK